MEMDEKSAGRVHLKKWMKKFAIFLAFIWICTIISKSFYVSQLPRVNVKTLDKKYIEHIVEVDGIVTAGGVQAVNVLPGLRVLGIKVQEGDYVEEGDVLFEIDLMDLSDAISDKETELAKLQYHLSDTQFNQILESQKKEISVLWAQEDYENADRETAVMVERAQKALSEAETELNRHLGTEAPYTSDSARQDAWDRYNDWKKQYYELMDKITAKEREIAGMEDELENFAAKTVLSGAQNDETSEEENQQEEETSQDITSENEEHKSNQDGTDTKRDELKELIKKANEELTVLQDALMIHERNAVLQPDYSAEEIAYDNWQQTKSGLEDAVQAAKYSLEDALYTRASTLQQKSRAIASAEVLSPADSTASVYALEMEQIQSEINSLKSLKKGNGEITAAKSGFVSKIQIEVGGRTADIAAMLLTDADAACRFKCSITKEQGKYLNLGDSVELKINGTGGVKLEVAVDYLTEGVSGGYDIICRLPENTGQPGAGGSIRRTVQGDLYSAVIPVEALYQESEAYYIYTLNEKTGILGKELYVEKLKVKVLDQNDSYAALEAGTVGTDVQIVTFCSEELKQGASVRLANS